LKLYILHLIETGNFKLDGGAMFGVVPKTIWQKTNPADANNMCDWAMRCVLIENGKQLILMDTGIGDKQSEKFFLTLFLCQATLRLLQVSKKKVFTLMILPMSF
jgi:hypothetical protein